MENKQTEKAYEMDGKAVKNRAEFTKIVCDTLRGKNDLFVDNLNSVHGPLYNAVSFQVYRGANHLGLLMTAKDRDGQPITDQRFTTKDQIDRRGGHLEKGCHGVSIENSYYDQNSKKIIVKSRRIFNGKDMDGLLNTDDSLKYDTAEKIQIMNNAEKRMKGSLKGQEYFAQKNNLEPLDIPRKENYPTRDDYYYGVLRNLSENNVRSGWYKDGAGRNRPLNDGLTPVHEYTTKSGEKRMGGGERLKGGERVSETTEIAKDRADFRAQVSTLLTCQELGVTCRGFLFKDPASADRLAKTYEEHPEKLFNDLKSATYLQEKVKDIIFEEKIRIPEKELTEEQKTAIEKGDYKQSYEYKPLNVDRKDRLIEAKEPLKDKYQMKEINAAREKALERIEREVQSIEPTYKNELILQKSLINEIAATRKELGRESDPSKFTKGYKEAGKEVVIIVNDHQIQRNNMTKEQILNTFANGKEKDDIIAKVREKASVRAVEKSVKLVNERTKAKELQKAEIRERQKKEWKEKQIEQTKPKQRARSITGRDLGSW